MKNNVGEGQEPAPLLRLGAIAYFMGSSILVQYTTKAIFTTYRFNFPVTIAFLQMLIIAPVSYTVARPELNWGLARGLAPLALVNVANVVAGLVGTQGLNVPMFIALRRFTLLITILLERFWLHKTHDWPTLAAMTIMIGGAVMAAATDLTFNVRGYMAVLANDMLTSLYLILVKNTPVSHSLSTTGMLFYNSVLSLPLLGIVLLARGEPGEVASFPLLQSTSFQLALLLAAGMGLTINHSTMLCTRLNEPLMTSVAGNLKNVLMTVVGAMAFGDFVFSGPNAAGLAVSMTGAVWYATRSAFKARQRALKSSLLTQLPVIGGRDRLRHRASMAGIDAAHRAVHARTGSSGNVGAFLLAGGPGSGAGAGLTRLSSGTAGMVQSGNLGPLLTGVMPGLALATPTVSDQSTGGQAAPLDATSSVELGMRRGGSETRLADARRQ